MELYIHLPFCRRKCRYCDFASWSGQEDRMADYVSAVIREAENRAGQIGRFSPETVFVGGGTPSVLPPDLFSELLQSVFRLFPPEDGAEISVEANPGTLSAPWLTAAVSCGVNRISMGMQAAQPTLLETLGRIHRPEDVAESVRLVRDAGIGNLNLDLMFGLPGQTEAMWRETLEAALALSPEHLSCYGLIPEDGTPLKTALDNGSLTLPPEETERAMYDTAIRLLAENGYRQYEISNFARPGYACRHNIGYWRRVPYLGLGTAAASMFLRPDGSCLRETNPSTVDTYIPGCGLHRESETVCGADAMFESLMLGLRMTDGVSESAFRAMYGVAMTEVYGPTLDRLRQRGLLRHEDGAWKLTRRGMDIQNTVLVELMDPDA